MTAQGGVAKTAAQTVDPPSGLTLRKALIVLTAAVASLLEILDTSIVNVAIPTMMGNLGSTLDEISWVTTGYMIANSIVLPIASWLGMRMGRRVYFTGAILAFTVASFCCGMAPNLPFLVFFRILQGLAGGALLPTSQTLIQESFPPSQAGIAMAVFGVSIMVGPALGPVLGGYLTDHFGWRSIFNINVPLGLIASFMAWSNVEDSIYAKAPKEAQGQGQAKQGDGIDWTGLLLLCIGVGCLQFFLERGQAEDWFDSKWIVLTFWSAIAALSAFVYWELQIPNPIMNLRLFKSGILRSGTSLMLALGIILFALTFAIPVFVSNVIPQMTAAQTGLLFMPGAIATGLLMFPSGFLLSRTNPKLLVLFGLAMAEVSTLMMTQFGPFVGPGDLQLPLLVRGMGMAFLFIPINQMVLGSFQGQELAQVAGMQNFFRQLGGSIGIASLGTLLSRLSSQNIADLTGKMSALDPYVAQQFQSTLRAPLSKMSSQLGMYTPSAFAFRSFGGRIQHQVFLLSFSQLVWMVSFVVLLGLIPLYFIKPKPRVAGAGKPGAALDH